MPLSDRIRRAIEQTFGKKESTSPEAQEALYQFFTKRNLIRMAQPQYYPPRVITDHALLTNVQFGQHHAHFVYEIPIFATKVFGRHSEGFAVVGAAARVVLSAFEVQHLLTISGLLVVHGAVAAGNFRVAVYGPAGAPYSADGCPLIDESASTLCSGTNRVQLVALSGGDRQLQPGIYYGALQPDNNTDTYQWAGRGAAEVLGDHFDYARYFANPGGYGAFANPVPATTSDSYGFMIIPRVASIP